LGNHRLNIYVIGGLGPKSYFGLILAFFIIHPYKYTIAPILTRVRAWAEILLWASFGLFLLYIHTSIQLLIYSLRSRQGTGTGICRTLCSPLPLTGMKIVPLNSSRGLKLPYLHPLMEEIPVGDRGPIAIPSPAARGVEQAPPAGATNFSRRCKPRPGEPAPPAVVSHQLREPTPPPGKPRLGEPTPPK
jgi:hypothetical protein